MSLTRRMRREAAREQAQQRLRRALAARRQQRTRGSRWQRLPAALISRRAGYIIVALLLAIVFAVPIFGSAPSTQSTATPIPDTSMNPAGTPAPEKSFSDPPAMQLTPGAQYQAVIQTAQGTMRAELYPDAAPAAVNNFLFLARQQYYTGQTVNNVISGQEVALGAPSSDESGGPGYTIPLTPNNQQPKVGSLVVPVDGNGSMGSQFAILLSDSPPPGRNYVVFGRITDGLDIARRLQAGDRITGIQSVEIPPASAAPSP